MKATIRLLLIFLFVSLGLPVNGQAQRGAITGIERFETTATERAGQRTVENSTRVEISTQLTKELAVIPENTAAKIAQSAEAQQAARQIAVKETERFEQHLQRQQQENAVRETAEANRRKIIEQARLERESSVAVQRQQEEAAAKKATEDKARQDSARLERDRIAQKKLSDEIATRTVQPTKLPEKPIQTQASISAASGNLNLQQQEIRKAAGDFSKLPTKAKEDVGYALREVEQKKGQVAALEERARANAFHEARDQETRQFFEKQKQQQEKVLAAKKENENFVQKKKKKEEAQVFADKKRQDEALLAKKAQSDARAFEKRNGNDIGSNQNSKRIPWGSWSDYNKVNIKGNTYAQIGDRYYTRHAVDRMQPSGLGASAGTIGKGHSFPPVFVEDVIRNGVKRTVVRDGVSRVVHFSGTAEVVTEQNGKIVVTVNPFRGTK